MAEPSSPPAKLSPWPIRLAVYLALVAAAILAIWIIDGHVMARMSRLEPPAATQNR